MIQQKCGNPIRLSIGACCKQIEQGGQEKVGKQTEDLCSILREISIPRRVTGIADGGKDRNDHSHLSDHTKHSGLFSGNQKDDDRPKQEQTIQRKWRNPLVIPICQQNSKI